MTAWLKIMAVLTVLALAASPGRADRDPSIAEHVDSARSTPEPRFEVRGDYEFEDVDDDLDTDAKNWHLVSIQWSGKFSFGSLLGRVNQARRFGRNGTQLEVDSYPRFTERMYGYFNVGYSGDRLFPEWRFGAEPYWNLPRGFEASVGARHLDFRTSDVTIYTGSVGYYTGNWWFSLRPYFSDKPEGTSNSGEVIIRRYLETAEDYISLRLGAGESPDEDVLAQEVNRLDSWKILLRTQRVVFDSFIVRGKIGFREEELAPDRDRTRFVIGIGFGKLF